MVTDESQWYVQKGSRVQGPFSTTEVGRFLLLGRVRNTDRVSRDGELWEPVTQVPELIPEELLNLQSDEGWNQFLKIRADEDERKVELAAVPERRASEDSAPVSIRNEWAAPDNQAVQSVLPWSLLGITLAALSVILYLNASSGLIS